MSWFKVDDQLHNHRKARAVLRSAAPKRRDVAPMGLWALAGSWCGQNRTGGFVPAELLDDWDDDAHTLAERLIEAGLWRRDELDGEPGFRFHDWADRNPAGTADGGDAFVSASTRANHVRWHVKRRKVAADCPLCAPLDPSDSVGIRPDSADRFGSPSDLCSTTSDVCSNDDEAVNPQVICGDPIGFRAESDRNPPVPVPEPDKSGGYVGRERYVAQVRTVANDPPPAHCPQHPDGTPAACGDCRATRLASEADRARHLREAKAVRESEMAERAAAAAAAIAGCGLCDDDGRIHGGSVCDHVDRQATNARGMAGVRAELEAIAARKTA